MAALVPPTTSRPPKMALHQVVMQHLTLRPGDSAESSICRSPFCATEGWRRSPAGGGGGRNVSVSPEPASLARLKKHLGSSLPVRELIGWIAPLSA